MFPDIDVNILHANYAHTAHDEGFDSQIARFSHVCEIHLFKDKWCCSCPCFMQFGMCKHVISFQTVVLKQEVPAEYHIVRLRSRAKRGRPKKVPSSLNFVHFSDPNPEVEDFSDEEIDDEGECVKSLGVVV